ncbi:MAG: hypothetical protein GY738_07560 [Pseudoalteromonas sp.]|nr:hypothetical protein [Pseudoalteromonas sp.]
MDDQLERWLVAAEAKHHATVAVRVVASEQENTVFLFFHYVFSLGVRRSLLAGVVSSFFAVRTKMNSCFIFVRVVSASFAVRTKTEY